MSTRRQHDVVATVAATVACVLTFGVGGHVSSGLSAPGAGGVWSDLARATAGGALTFAAVAWVCGSVRDGVFIAMTAHHVCRVRRYHLAAPMGIGRPGSATRGQLSLVEDRTAPLVMSRSALPDQDPHCMAGGRPPDVCRPCADPSLWR